MWVQFAAFGLVVVALCAFLVSSLQLKLGWRVFALLVGSISLGLATFASLSIERSNMFLAIWSEWPAIRTALAANMRTVQSSFSPVLDISLFITGVLGVLTALALTPGDGIERVIRPFKKGMIGAIIGCVVTLLIVGLGFGAQTAPNAYIGYVDAKDIADGDTLKMGSVSLRLWGIDAPERDQQCLDANSVIFPCGAASTSAMRELIATHLVSCRAPDPKCTGDSVDPDRNLKQTFGRPLVTCTIYRDDQTVDLAREMVVTGQADCFAGTAKSCYEPAARAAKNSRIGMWSGWSLRPDDWRNNKPCQEWIKTDASPPSAPVIDCSTLPAANDN